MNDAPSDQQDRSVEELTELAMDEARLYAHGTPSETVTRVENGAFTVVLPRTSSGEEVVETMLDGFGFDEVERRTKSYPDGRKEYYFRHRRA